MNRTGKSVNIVNKVTMSMTLGIQNIGVVYVEESVLEEI